MRGFDGQLTDVTLHHPRTLIQGVRSPGAELRPWIENFPVCVAFDQYHIVHVGIEKAMPPTRVVRTKQSTTYFLACYGGKGRVLIDGRWRLCKKGMACLLPAHTLNAFETVPGETWEFCWVCYQRPVDQRPVADATSPVLAQYDALPLRAAIQGLLHECNGPAEPALMQEWTDLINAYVMRFAKPADQPDKLRLLWERVASNLAEEWTLSKLAKHAGYSSEHLRRLCRRQLGRSPMHQVTYMRMRKATELLVSTDLTVEAIAEQVGYHNPFVFSNAFTKWIGWRPSEYRRKKNFALGKSHTTPQTLPGI